MARLKLTAENTGQERILAYLEENASDSLVERINNGKKTMGSCWQYITGMARKRAKGNCACIEDSEVYNWAIHYFEEDNVRIETAQPEKKEEKQTISFAEIKAIQKEKERKAQQEALDRINEAKRKEEQLRKEKQKEDRKRKRKMAQRFREVSQELRRFETVGKAYCIIIPKEPKDLVTEGKAMNNCVGHMGYELKMANGKSFIAFMRTVADREHSFITIEYDLEKKTLRQCYGHGNSRPKPDEQAFADEWAANVTKKLREEERIARKKAAEEAMQEALGPIEKKYKPGAEPRREAIA